MRGSFRSVKPQEAMTVSGDWLTTQAWQGILTRQHFKAFFSAALVLPLSQDVCYMHKGFVRQ